MVLQCSVLKCKILRLLRAKAATRGTGLDCVTKPATNAPATRSAAMRLSSQPTCSGKTVGRPCAHLNSTALSAVETNNEIAD